MENDREDGRTFAPDDIGWLDFETKSAEDIKAGTYRYMSEADAVICAFALGDGPTRYVPVKTFNAPLCWDDMPKDFKAFHDRVMAGTAIWCAWNAGFDKAAWNFATIDFPWMEAEHIIDAMVQATVNGLPAASKSASNWCTAGLSTNVYIGPWPPTRNTASKSSAVTSASGTVSSISAR